MLMLVAGFETTRNAFAGGVQTLLEHPAQMQYLREHPKGMRRAVEEVARWTNAAVCLQTDGDRGYGTRRQTDQKRRQYRGLVPPRRTATRMCFENADVFDITRHPNPHIGFAAGAHFCAGAPLAKLELEIALQEVLDRYDGIEVIGPVEYIPSNYVFGLATMPVRLQRKAVA